ncbi:hypothetical protein FQN60_009110, partial [Etheostoma spectabile]
MNSSGSSIREPHFLPELNTRRATFERAQFIGVFKKVMRPPVGQSTAVNRLMKALPNLFHHLWLHP